MVQWYQQDRKGIEQFFGVTLPKERDYVDAFNMLFEQQRAFTARILMAERDDQAVGFLVLTDIPPSLEYGRGHIYVAPDERRHSLDVMRAGVAEAKAMGLTFIFQQVQSSNRAALTLGKRVGFVDSGTLTLRKEL